MNLEWLDVVAFAGLALIVGFVVGFKIGTDP